MTNVDLIVEDRYGDTVHVHNDRNSGQSRVYVEAKDTNGRTEFDFSPKQARDLALALLQAATAADAKTVGKTQ